MAGGQTDLSELTDAELAAEILRRVHATESRPRVTIRVLQQAASQVFKITLKQLNGRGRGAAIVRPRQAVDYLAKEMTNLSFPQIARRNGGRDHSSAIYGREACQRRMKGKPEYAEKVEAVRLLALAGTPEPYQEPPPPEPEPEIDLTEVPPDDVVALFAPGERIPERLLDTMSDEDWLSLNVAAHYAKEAA